MSGVAEEDDLRAAEYVLGTLDESERATVARRAETDDVLNSAIAAWEIRLSPLAVLVSPVTPPPELWRRIEQSLGAPVVAEARRPARRSFWESLGFWRGVSGAGFALAAALAVLVLLRPVPPTGPSANLPSASAVLAASPGGPPAYLAEADTNGRLTLHPLTHVAVASDRDLELWALPVGGTKPQSLGVLRAAGGGATLPQANQAGMQLMVSLEPRGGSPTGAPTGPVLFAGRLARL